jgi:pimeloyl-ACP methyl ester carboxylesterase
MKIKPFPLPYSEKAVSDLRERLARTRWPDEIAGSNGKYGFPLAYLQELCLYWREKFDWRKQLDEWAQWPHFLYDAGGVGVHFIHARGKGPAPVPLVLTHGWPGSFVEMLKIIPLLTDPGGHGADPADSFDVIVPSLPGFGFSRRPTAPGMNTFRMAEVWADMMTELGYSRFAAQGGDFGAAVTTILGLRHPERMIGIHLNYIPGSYRPSLAAGESPTEIEQEYLRSEERWYQQWGAYSHVQSIQPQTVAYGLNDSPAALAAWIVEKFRDWADCDGDVEKRFSKDELLANVTLYWMTETIHSSCRLYLETSQAPVRFRQGERVTVPCGIIRFAKEDPFPPRCWIERGYNIQQWTEIPHGGHFAAAEEPALLAEDIRRFFRPLRTA